MAVRSVTDCAVAKLAFAIAALAFVVTAVDKTPVIPVTSPLLACENTASSLSKSLATDPAADVAVLLMLVDNAPATPVISVPENVNCDSNSVTLLALELIFVAFVLILVFAVAIALVFVPILVSSDTTQALPLNIYSLLLSFVSYQSEFAGNPVVEGASSCLKTLGLSDNAATLLVMLVVFVAI